MSMSIKNILTLILHKITGKILFIRVTKLICIIFNPFYTYITLACDFMKDQGY